MNVKNGNEKWRDNKENMKKNYKGNVKNGKKNMNDKRERKKPELSNNDKKQGEGWKKTSDASNPNEETDAEFPLLSSLMKTMMIIKTYHLHENHIQFQPADKNSFGKHQMGMNM